MIVQPRPFGESLNEWFRALGRHWRALLLLSLKVFVPLGLLVGAAFLLTGAGDALTDLMDPDFVETLSDDDVLDVLAPIFWASGLWILLQSVATVYVNLETSRIVATGMAGRTDADHDPAAGAIPGLGSGLLALLLIMLGAGALVAVPVLVGWGLFASFGAGFLTVFATTTVALTVMVLVIWLGLAVSLYAQVIALEGRTGIASLRRSFSLVQTRWWSTAGFLLVTSLIASAAGQIASFLVVPVFFLGAFQPLLLAIAYGASVVLYGPLTAAIAVAYVVWYVDLRARRETLTLDELA